MVSVVQWLEHWIVVPVVGGSSPLAHPIIFVLRYMRGLVVCSWGLVKKK